MADKVKKMKEAVAANRKVKGEPPPPKPVETALTPEEKVFEVLFEMGGNVVPTSTMENMAVAVVKAFPQIGAKPKSKTRKCCGTLVGPGPHRPDCVQLTHAKPDPAQE